MCAWAMRCHAGLPMLISAGNTAKDVDKMLHDHSTTRRRVILDDMLRSLCSSKMGNAAQFSR